MTIKKQKIVTTQFLGTDVDTLNYLMQSYGKSEQDVIRKALRLLANHTTGNKKIDSELWNSVE